MRIVLTLLCRDNADIVDAHLAFHLASGVDFVIATDNRSVDGTDEILEAHERAGRLRLIREPGEDIRQSDWVTRMARLAAREHGADWVINSDADEFWWPRGGDLKEVLGAIPDRYGIVRGVWRSFVPRPSDGGHWADRMTARLSAPAPINDPASPYRPAAKIAHRADPDVVVGGGDHELVQSALVPLRGWYPLEILHFPLRSLEQCRRKYVTAFEAWRRNPRRTSAAYHANAYQAFREGRLADYYASLSVDDAELERGLDDGSLELDLRLRDALRALGATNGDRASMRFAPPTDPLPRLVFPTPGIVDDAAYAADASVLGEADVVRLQRRADELEHRLAAVERRSWRRRRRRTGR
jgi:hypothetical protein